MFIQIVQGVRVFVSEKQLEFISRHRNDTFKSTELPAEEIETARVLADKAVFVRKKLDSGVQYTLNRRIKFIKNDIKK